MKAIRTRYSGPTNTRGSRVTATDADGNRFVQNYRHELNSEQMHELAAYQLMKMMKWPNYLIGGGFGPDQYWVMLPGDGQTMPAYDAILSALQPNQVSR